MNGHLEVTTTSGTTYRIGTGLVERAPTRTAATMRRDGIPIELLHILRLETGTPMLLLVAPLGPGADATTRVTTDVASVLSTPSGGKAHPQTVQSANG